jgi:hypothetical protein
VQILAHRVGARVAQHALGGRVPVTHATIRVHHHDGIQRGLGDRQQLDLAAAEGSLDLVSLGSIARLRGICLLVLGRAQALVPVPEDLGATVGDQSALGSATDRTT